MTLNHGRKHEVWSKHGQTQSRIQSYPLKSTILNKAEQNRNVESGNCLTNKGDH